MLLFGNTGKRSGFAHITIPEHVVKELLKLHCIEFNPLGASVALI